MGHTLALAAALCVSATARGKLSGGLRYMRYSEKTKNGRETKAASRGAGKRFDFQVSDFLQTAES